MAPEIAVGLLSLAGTLIGSLAGVMAANKLTVYRIEQLEKKVDKHNTVIESYCQCSLSLLLFHKDMV